MAHSQMMLVGKLWALLLILLCNAQASSKTYRKGQRRVIDGRIEEMTLFAKRLAGDGFLHDAIHILQAVALRLKSPYYVGMRLKNYKALIEASNQLAYQNKSLYAIVEQTDNKFSLSKKIVSIHFQVLVTLHSAGDLHHAKTFLIKLYKALIQTSRSKSKRRKMKTLFPPQGLFLMIEILFQYRYFQHILDVHKITKKIYSQELWSTSDDLKRYIRRRFSLGSK